MYKYLNDGRKVCVVGKINSTEFIVQEIFIAKDGSELPAGENFVVKSLHDNPVKSYHETQLEKLKEKELKAEQNLEDIEAKTRKAKKELSMMQDMFKSCLATFEAINKNKYTLETLSSFLSGGIEWVVLDSYGLNKPERLKDVLIQDSGSWGRFQYEGLKLVTLYGKEDGNLEYRLKDYKDGSGSTKKIYPFCTFDEAVEKVKCLAVGRLEKDYFTKDDLNICNDLNIEFNKEQRQKIESILNQQNEVGIENNKKCIKEAILKIKSLKSSINTLKETLK